MNRIFKSIGFNLLLIVAIFSLGIQGTAHAGTPHSKDSNGYVVFLEPEKGEWEVFNYMVDLAGLRNMDFALETEDDINGTTWSAHRISVTQGTIKQSLYYYNDYRLVAAVIAHELGHTQDNELDNAVGSKAIRNAERRADYYATKLLYRSKYGCEVQATVIRTWENGYISKKVGATHPSDYERLNSAIKNCDSLNKTGHLPANLYYE